METSWLKSAQAAFSEIYPGGKALEICTAVMPGIIGDFRATVLRAESGAAVSEEYRTEDNRTSVTLTGHRDTRAGKPVCVVTAMNINGAAIALDPGGLVL